MPIETEDSTDISGLDPTPGPAPSPQQMQANANRRVKAKSPGQQQQSKQPPGAGSPLGQLAQEAQQAGQDISGGAQNFSRGLRQQGFATPTGDPWNMLDWAKETAQDAGATWGITRKIANTLGGQFSDGVANVWQGHSGTDWLLKQTAEAGVWVNPFSALSAAFQLEDPKGEGLGGLLDVSDTEYAQRQQALQQGGQAGLQQQDAKEQQREDSIMKQSAQTLPGSYFDLATSLLAPEDKLAMLGAQGVPPIVESFITGSPSDQQHALEWMTAMALLTYIPIGGPIKKALIKKLPSLEKLLGSTEEAQKAAQQGARGASNPTQAAQQTKDAIDKQLSHGAMPEHYSEKPVARGQRPDEPIPIQATRDPNTNAIQIQESVQKQNIRRLLSKIGVSDTDELVDKLRANAISDKGTLRAIQKNWKALGLPYDLYRYAPEEQALRDPKRWLDSLGESVPGVLGKAAGKVTGKAPKEFEPSALHEFTDQPGTLRGYQTDNAAGEGRDLTRFTTDKTATSGALRTAEVQTDKPFLLNVQNSRGLIDKALELGLLDAKDVLGDKDAKIPAKPIDELLDSLLKNLNPDLTKWLTDQGYDSILDSDKGAGRGISLDGSKVKVTTQAKSAEGETLGGLTEGHNYIVALNAYLDQIHRGVFGNGSDPMQSLLRSLAGYSRATNFIDQYYMAATVDLLKGQMTEALGNKIGRAVEGDQKAYDELPVQAKMIADGWGLLRAASREEAKDTDYFESVVPNWMPRPDKLLGDVIRKRGRPSVADSLLAKDALRHRDEKLMLDPKGHIVLGQKFQFVADANKALAKTREQLVADLLSPGKKLSKELENDPKALAIRKLVASDPDKAKQQAEVLAWQKYADKETNFLKNTSRSFANQVRATHTHAALEQFVQMKAADGRALARKAMSPRQRDQFRNQGYELINDPRFLNFMFHPDVAKNLNRYIDHVKLPDFPEFVASDGRKLIMKPDSLNQAAKLTEQGYHTLEAPLFGGVSIGLHQPWLFHPDVETISDLTSKAGKYWWGKVKSPEWWWNEMIKSEGKAVAAIMFSPAIHALNIASRFGMGYMLNPKEMTHYLFQKGAKPWDREASDLQMRMEAFNAGVLPHARNKSWADNVLSTMSDALGDIEDQLPDAFKDDTKANRMASLWDKRPRPMKVVNNHFWGAVNDYGVMMYHLEKEAAKNGIFGHDGMAEADAREFAARRANSWMGAVAPEDTNPLMHQISRLVMFAPNWWRTWAELMLPMYKRAGFATDHTYLKYRAYQSAKTMAAAVAFQKLTGEALNYLATSSTPWARDGHWQQQNQQENKDRIEATGAWLNDIPGFEFFAPTPDVNSADPTAKAAGQRGSVRTIENPLGRQQFAMEEAAGLEEGVPYWKPEDTWDGLAKFVAARAAPLLDAAFGATNIDMYQSVSDHQLRAIDTTAPAGSISPGSLLTGALMMTPFGLQFAQNVQKSSAQGDTNPVESVLGTKVPDSLQSFVGDLKDPAARMLWSALSGTNAPYDTAQKSRGTKPSDEDYQHVVEYQRQYQQQMNTLNGEALSGQLTPSQWRTAYSDLAKQHAAQLEAIYKGSPSYVDGPEGMLNDYMALYDDPKVVNKDGTINQDMLTQLQNQFRQQHSSEQLQQMDALMRQNDSKYPMLKLYHTMLDNYDKFQQDWATQNNVDLSTLHKDISGYSALYGDTRGSQLYLRQHPELNRYERAKTAWQRNTRAGMLYALFYGTSAGSTLLTRTGRPGGPTATQLAEQLGQPLGG